MCSQNVGLYVLHKGENSNSQNGVVTKVSMSCFCVAGAPECIGFTMTHTLKRLTQKHVST